MHWLFGAGRLKRAGVLGMNRRNAECILDHNPRSRFVLADDKWRLHALCQRLGVPTPALYAVIHSGAQLRQLPQTLGGHADFVLKPNRGAAGRGVLVVTGRVGRDYRRHNGQVVTLEQLRQQVSDILSGMHSLGGRPDQALVQFRVRLHPAFVHVAYQGIPDVRVLLYRNEPALAMLRLPTRESNGRANLHQGGVGVGVDLASGVTLHAVQHNRALQAHPDTGQPLVGLRVPSWDEILDLSRRVARAVGLGYIGVDVVVDAEAGPLLLEANARPGLAIQVANGRGLLPCLAAIDEQAGHAPVTIESPARAA
jgi:alpha-L-glutamate ligase-like protein